MTIWSGFKWILLILIGVFTYQKIKKIKIGPVKEKRMWTPVNKKTVEVYDKEGKIKKIKLPKDPETKKQLTINDIEAIGITEKGNINVKIKHNRTNRRLSNLNNN